MADDAEKKNISRLDFKIDDAINSLDLIDKKLKSIAETSGKFSQQISQNIGKGISVNINTDDLKKNFVNVENMTKASRERLTVNAIKEEQKHQNKMIEISAKGEQQRQNYAAKTASEQIKYNDRVAQSTESLYNKITQYAKTYIIYQGFNELKKGISETIDEMVEMEQQMVGIDRVLNESGLDIDNYRDKLIQLAHDYGNTFNNVADITLRLAQAGFSSNEAIALTEKTLLALNTAELNATQATDDMVAVMAQWGLMTGNAADEARNYGEIIDKINKVADNYPTTSADLMDALKKVSSAFNLAGASIDETIATIVAAEKASQRGGKVIGTALSNIVQQIKAEGKLNLAEQLGLDFFEDDAKTKFKPIMEIFQEMADRMEKLKAEGKESSVEMQQLLEMFTVFRRNIGASLLGEMSGEDSTYLNVLNDSLTAVGYSLQENEKYMKTAKAAQAQFNAELLKLKTQVWDNGLEGAFRDMLSMGTDVVKGISNIINKFGLLPTTIGAVTAAYTVLSNKVKIQDIISLTKKVSEINSVISSTGKAISADNKLLEGTSASFKKYATSVDSGRISLVGYGKELVVSTAKTALLTAGTIALNAAISFGLSAAITLIVSAIDGWIHSQENAIKKSKELKEAAEDNANTLSEERNQLQELRKEYEELAKKDNRTTEENQKIYELQTKINGLIKDTGQQVDLVNVTIDEQGKRVLKVNDAYDEQLKIIKAIEYEKKMQETKNLKEAMEQAQKISQQSVQETSIKGVTPNEFENVLDEAGIIDMINSTMRGHVYKDRTQLDLFYNTEDISVQINLLEEWIAAIEKMENPTKTANKTLEGLKEKLSELEEAQKSEIEATQNYSDALSELYAMSGQVDTFDTFLDSISKSYNIEGPQNLIEEIKTINQEFSDGTINVEEYFDKIQEKISEIDLSTEGEELEAYQAIFAATTESLAEGISQLNAGLESGTINFADYSVGIKEAADNMLALRAEQENLTFDEGVWKDASGNVDEYANSLQNAINELSDMGDLLTTIGDNYDYIAEHANAAGEAMFKQADVGTEAYNNLANSVAASLERMKASNSNAYNAIVDKVYQSTGDMANEEANASNYINNALLTDANALNAALNESANQVSQSTNRVAQSMGKVLSELGNAISNFTYNITATPYITGKLGLEKDDKGIPTRLNLPTFGFDITGTGGESIQGLGSALSSFGADLTDLANNQFRYNQIRSQIDPYTPSTRSGGGSGGSGGGGGSGGSGGGSGSGSSRNSSSIRDTSAEDAAKAAAKAAEEAEKAAAKAAEEAAKAEKEEYKKRLATFKEYISEKERLENRWVNKQKELGQLSTDDYLFITQQRIERYKEYLEEVEKATWMNEEDKLALQKTYTEKIEDLQVDYFGYLKDKLDEEVKALKKANEEKIKSIEEEADARIAALRKVESENDRIRTKEEYEKRRQEHLDDISYWEQRTGREAQEALKKAKENLKELDEQWEQQMQDWSIEDQIKAIEDERDAQVKAIEEAQEAEIAAMQAVYDAKVKAFAETGQLIYESSEMQSEALYEVYKDNFITPILEEIKKINQEFIAAQRLKEKLESQKNETDKGREENSKRTATAQETKKQEPVVEKQYETYVIQWGDTLTAIARKFGTTIQKIMEANPYVTNPNKIYAGKTLQIPKFHEGGIVGGTKEAFALLKPHEVILKPEWAEGINKLAKMAKSTNTINNTSTVIEVEGDLVKIQADIKNKTDADYLAKRVEKILKDKFNIKK